MYNKFDIIFIDRLNKVFNSQLIVYFLLLPRQWEAQPCISNANSFETIRSRPRKLLVPPGTRYPHNYFLIEQPAARERRFQFAAQSSNAFIPRKRTQPEPLFSRSSRRLYLNALFPPFFFLRLRITSRCCGFAILSRGIPSLWMPREERGILVIFSSYR